MDKKLIYINITVLILIFTLYVLGYALINYPMRFDILYLIKEYGLGVLLIIVCGITLVSYLISSLEIKKLSFRFKFLRVFLILNSLLLFGIAFITTKEFLEKRKLFIERENEYIQQAKQDIKNDHIVFKFAGGFEVPNYNEDVYKKVDSIQKNYGVEYKNTGCIIDPVESNAQEKYKETVMPYLERRNGKGWKTKMDGEIEKMKKLYDQKYPSK
ncbi:hypothetical protein [Chryseobacterium sp. ERMR1:04]|uniref:FEKKY domain-containing protein n=1 Tax=Chryseobacterium sp. ERMR1:04 TaxID=1705393 RepID=UPI0006C8A028|nr:hypothetical protein [Chryseobacterium sp. ERMR1:04]